MAGLEGSLEDLPFLELLEFLAGSRRTGVIELSGASPGIVVLHEGMLTLALSENGPTLQQVFIGSGIVSSDGWWEATNTGNRSSSLAEAVLEAGAPASQVERVLREQIIGAVFELMLPSKDAFAFTPGATHLLGHRFLFDPDDVVREAQRRVAAWKVIADSIPSTSLVVVPVRYLPGDSVTINSTDWTVLALLDGQRSIADIIRELGMSAFAVCNVLHQLRTAGIVEPRG
ncbi:MAG: DUF4388 domain-containing protein [Actinobacteria bacterium]|nr:DUF4388 domain-containing protein [Actinomycetota bacterium]